MTDQAPKPENLVQAFLHLLAVILAVLQNIEKLSNSSKLKFFGKNEGNSYSTSFEPIFLADSKYPKI